MFTKPNFPARPRLATHPRATQPSTASFEPVPSKPGPPNARNVSGADLHRKAQAELERLLQRLGRAPEAVQSARPTSGQARPTRTEASNGTAWQEPTFTQPQTGAHNPASRFAQEHPRSPVQSSLPQSTQTAIERKLLEHKAALVVMAVLIALALAWSVIGQAVTSAGVERVAATVGLHAKKIVSLEGQQAALVTTITRRLDAMHLALAEVQYPPSEFAEAQNLFKAGRYADAESAYHAFLLHYPNSRVADKALNNAAVAAAMRNNCSMAESYVKQLQTQFPISPLRVATKDLASQCRKLRATP